MTGPAAVDVPSEFRGRTRTASPLTDAGYRTEGTSGPTDLLSPQAARAKSARLELALIGSDDRLMRRRRLPQPASPGSTYEVETSHPPVELYVDLNVRAPRLSSRYRSTDRAARHHRERFRHRQLRPGPHHPDLAAQSAACGRGWSGRPRSASTRRLRRLGDETEQSSLSGTTGRAVRTASLRGRTWRRRTTEEVRPSCPCGGGPSRGRSPGRRRAWRCPAACPRSSCRGRGRARPWRTRC